MLLTTFIALVGLVASRAVPDFRAPTQADVSAYDVAFPQLKNAAGIQKIAGLEYDSAFPEMQKKTPAGIQKNAQAGIPKISTVQYDLSFPEILKKAQADINTISLVDKVRKELSPAKIQLLDQTLEKIYESEDSGWVLVNPIPEAEFQAVAQIEKLMRESQLKKKAEIKEAGNRWGLGWLFKAKDWILNLYGGVFKKAVKTSLCTTAQIHFGIPFFVTDYVVSTVAKNTANKIMQGISGFEGLQNGDFSLQDIIEYSVYKIDKYVQYKFPATKTSRDEEVCQIM
ncbi:hypothetical protein NEOLI_005488 [Neolecta irregularis DAH-3]|uniref:Uncharacterized protein n=1 Tax=Neolecta irregularis (strain DAH-3) TaxID=1198029 RepID=A0A1U7LLD4_NEOID|nr:hypothetical protein NEOLI_005488 [Neolecta irregularis DAH-3]|eukprot:OLL23476.1 hypothetical protein NEOLI_005488 [Neolecta irregularis DAH-3]